MVDVATYCPQTSTCSMCIGLRKLDECMTIASVLLSLRTSPLSESHVLTSLNERETYIAKYSEILSRVETKIDTKAGEKTVDELTVRYQHCQKR